MFLKDKHVMTTPVPLFDVDKHCANDDKEDTKVSKKGGVFGGVWGLDLFDCAS